MYWVLISLLYYFSFSSALVDSDFEELESLQWKGDVLLQYTSGSWDYDLTWEIFAQYCAVHGCHHVVVHGECPYTKKMCKRLVFLLTALRTTYVHVSITQYVLKMVFLCLFLFVFTILEGELCLLTMILSLKI